MLQLNKVYLALILITFVCMGCAKTFEPQNPEGSTFPSIRGEILTGTNIEIPRFFEGKPTLLLIGYVQESQFDIDRWVLGLKQLKTPIGIAEIPAIQGLVPRMIKSKIDQGMRNGIPEEDWGIVITVYKDAEKIARFLGNNNPRNVRAVLLDKAGKVRWFHDRGFSADKAIELDTQVRQLFGSSDQPKVGQ
ncbi:hypothetical protein BVY02_00520 [bacterium J17]|nr:hypothetical protein BVY02_00520 [bacterium J17]